MAILFDLDDTLLDDLAAKQYYMPKLYNHFKETIIFDENEFYENWKAAILKYHKMYTDGLMTFEEQRRERVREAFGVPNLEDEVICDVVKAFDEYFKEGWKPFHNTIGILEYFKNESMAIVTNGSSSQQNEKIDILGIRKYFKGIVISGVEGFAKPDKRIFQKACEILDCEPEECFFVGDSWENDILGSNNCGMISIWFNRYGKAIPEKLENLFVISDLEEILGIVN